jgi:HD superfamily phosphohydrolase
MFLRFKALPGEKRAGVFGKRCQMTRTSSKRTYLDPIHHDITLNRNKPEERLIIDLIDAPEFQRLRRIQQLGISFYTFQGAEGSRFTHSVGVMHVTSRLINLLAETNTAVAGQKAVALASALLHDVGHGPFSHVTEKILGYDHEDWSCRIISGDTKVRSILDKYQSDSNLSEKLVRVLKKKYQPKYVSHLISSQLDCDRFDYLLRDSYMTGTAYGLFALERILSSLEIDEKGDRIIVVGEKGQSAVEDYLFARYSMYAQVYYHKKNLAVRAHLSKLINRARQAAKAGKCFIDEPTRKWLMGEDLQVSEYLYLDDIQLTYHIKRWTEAEDSVLSDLASRFLSRHLFKATRIPEGKPDVVAEVEKQARKIAAARGFDPDYYVTIESTGFRPYDFYRPDSAVPQTNIMVRTETGVVTELSQLSLTIEALVKSEFQAHWLIFPSEIAEELDQIKTLVPAASR